MNFEQFHSFLPTNMLSSIKINSIFHLFFSLCSCKGECDGCKIDQKPPVSKKKWYQRWWDTFKKKVYYDFTSNAIATIWLMYDVATDILAGLEHWYNNDPLWALLTWALMFVPAILSFVMEVMFKRCSMSWKRVLGHLPLFQVFYHGYILKKLKIEDDKIRRHEEFYSQLDFNKLPENIKTDLKVKITEYEESKNEYSRLLTDLQNQKLFEGMKS